MLNRDYSAMPPPPAWTSVENEAEYHAHSKRGEIMSSGMLKKFRDCPYRYNQLVTGQAKEKDSTAYRFGRAVHSIVLEGHKAFNKRYAVGGPINEKTGKCYGVGTQKFAEWLAANGLSMENVISEEEADVLVTMANMAERHPGVGELLDFGWPELVVRASLRDVPCQIRTDWLTHDAAGNYVIVDLKTTDDITWFESDARRYGYLHQFAFYRDVFQEAVRCPVRVTAVALEKKEPFRVGMFPVPVEVLDMYSTENGIALDHYKHCLEHNEWPTMYEDPREFSLPRIGA